MQNSLGKKAEEVEMVEEWRSFQGPPPPTLSEVGIGQTKKKKKTVKGWDPIDLPVYLAICLFVYPSG